jgi:hypothetical protein
VTSFLIYNNKPGWVFIDWYADLDKLASMQGVLIWAFRRLILLGELTGNDVSNYTTLVEKMSQAAYTAFWNEEAGLFVSNGQISWSSQVFLFYFIVRERKEIGNRKEQEG